MRWLRGTMGDSRWAFLKVEQENWSLNVEISTTATQSLLKGIVQANKKREGVQYLRIKEMEVAPQSQPLRETLLVLQADL